MKIHRILILSWILLSLVSTNVVAYVYPGNETNYPYLNYPPGQVDQWNTYTKNCTSYVMWKINQAGLPFHNNPTGPNGSSVTMGNASTWDERAESIGYTVNTTPSIGNPVNWEANTAGSGPAGHVAWVEQIHTDSIYISEWNWNWGDTRYNERSTPGGNHYIYLINNTPGGNITISNKNVLNDETYSYNVSNGNSITVLPETNFYLGSNINLTSD